MIELEGLTKRFGSKIAVDHLSCQVRPGIVTGFLGPNGAGKSTTMRMMLDLDNPTSGTVRIDGKHYRELQEPLKYIGALLDAKAMHGGRSAYNNLLCLAQSNRIPSSRVDEVLDMVGLSAVARKKSKGFSLGMGQRLGIASALLGDPEILMFDEPVNGLDPEGIHWIRNLMKALASEGRTIFVSSHLMSEMALTADHLIVIGQGRLLADTSMADFIHENSRSYARLRSPQQERLRDVLHQEGFTVVETAGGVLEIDGATTEELGELAARHQLVLHELSSQRASLEEAFMQMTAGSVEYHAHSERDPAAEQPVVGAGLGRELEQTRGHRPHRRQGGVTTMASVPAVLTSEWTKIRSVSSTTWTLISAFAVTVVMGAALAALLNAQFDDLSEAEQATFDPTFVSFSGTILGQLAMVVFGVLVVGTEYSSGMIRTSLAAVPQRATFLLSKITVAGALALFVGLLTSFVSFFLGQAMLGDRGTDLGAENVLRAVVGGGLYMGLIAIFSMGVAAMLRSSMLSLGILMPFFFLVSQILSAVPGAKSVARYFPDQAGSKIMQVVPDAMNSDPAPYGPWAGLGIMVLWVLAAVLGGFLVLKKRDA